MKKILFPTDFSDNARKALFYAAELAQIANADLILLHSMHIPVIDGSTPVDTSTEILEDQRKFSEQKLNALIEELESAFTIKLQGRCEFGFATDLICYTAKELQVDIIAMGTKGASNILEEMVGSITAGVIKRSSRPVLAIPEGAKFVPIKRIAFATDLSDNDAEDIKAYYELMRAFMPEVHVVHVEINDKLATLPGHHHVSEVIDSYDRIKRVELQADDIEHALEDYVEREHIGILAVKRHNRGFFENLFHKSISKQLAYHSKVPLLVYHDLK
jgi:nucleotide-binding universal stress UspA family protein